MLKNGEKITIKFADKIVFEMDATGLPHLEPAKALRYNPT